MACACGSIRSMRREGSTGASCASWWQDHGYDPKKAVLAAQKLVQQDKIFAALGSIGTATAIAAMSIYLNAK